MSKIYTLVGDFLFTDCGECALADAGIATLVIMAALAVVLVFETKLLDRDVRIGK